MCLLGGRCLIPGLKVPTFKLHRLYPTVEVVTPSSLALLTPLLLSLNSHPREMRQKDRFSKLLGSTCLGEFLRSLLLDGGGALWWSSLGMHPRCCSLLLLSVWVCLCTEGDYNGVGGGGMWQAQDTRIFSILSYFCKHGQRGLKQKQTWLILARSSLEHPGFPNASSTLNPLYLVV